MNTPTISVPVDTLLNLAVLSKSDGVNAKGQMAEIIKGILDEHLKSLETICPTGRKEKENEV